jgi:methylmalonyl-CoA/ethylmalonyl-CoA epimerase
MTTHSFLTEIDHVAIAVRDLDAAVTLYEVAYGATLVHREDVAHDGVSEALLRVADSYVQLLTPTRAESPVARFLDERGEGLHHVAYRVDDCATAIAQARDAGLRLLDESPRPGSRGTLIAFVHPKGNLGTLVELVQEGPGATHG